jgi:osmoprotectant transport system permease protein
LTELKTERASEESSEDEKGQEDGQDAQQSLAKSRSWRKVLRYLTMPVFLILVGIGLYLYISGLQLDSLEQRSINQENIVQKMIQHVELSVVTAVLVVGLAVPAGVFLTRPVMRRVASPIVSIASIGQAIPSFGLLVLLAILGGFGFWWAIVALVVYAFLPVLRNTMVGIQQVDRSVIEAGRGMGMTKNAVLFRIELPLAIPIMLAGIRTALILAVGTAALATFTNGGGMGDIIQNGISLSRDSILITGAVMTAMLALTIDYLAGVAEDILKPKGLR